MAKSHVFVLMQISYPYIVWNNFPKFQKNCESSFWDMRQSMCIIVVWDTDIGGEGAQTRSLTIHKNEKITRTVVKLVK